MKFFKLTALALASTLVLAGCGGGSDNNNNSTKLPNSGGSTIPPKPPVDNKLSDIEQAKGIINTAKQFILDNKAIKDAYEGASDILNEQQEQRINVTFDIPEALSAYMLENNIAKLTSADIIALNAKNEAKFKNALGENITLSPSSDFVATQNANGKFILSGTTSVTSQQNDYVYDSITNTNKLVIIKDTFTIVFDGFKQSLSSNTSSTNFKGDFGFNNITIGSGTKAVVLSSLSQGATVSAQFSDKVRVNDEFNLDEANAAGITLEKAVIKLGDVKLKANDSIIEARDLELGFLDMSRKLADGSLVVRTLPSTIKLTGQWLKETPKTDVTISLNAVANEEDIKNVIKVTQDGDIEEAAGKFVGVEIVMSLKGQVARKNTNITTSIPIDIQANLKRMSRKDVELQGLNASVDGKKLYVTGKTILDTTYNVSCKCTQLNITQNNAAVNLKFDVNNDFVKQDIKTGKIADITVNGKVFGQLLENNGTFSAKFVDNSFIPLG